MKNYRNRYLTTIYFNVRARVWPIAVKVDCSIMAEKSIFSYFTMRLQTVFRLVDYANER